jgi:hypothetical protein
MLNISKLLDVLVDMQNLRSIIYSARIQPPDRTPRRFPSRGALVAILLAVVVLAAFGHISVFSLPVLVGVVVLAAVLRRRRSGKSPRG